MIAAASRTRARPRSPGGSFPGEVIRTLLYYDLWQYPLTAAEIRAFLPARAGAPEEFRRALERLVGEGRIAEDRGFYSLPGRGSAPADARLEGARHARRMWIAARLAAHLIKRFPFVRAVLVSGDLSKHMTRPGSDVDFLILTEPGRLWIARMLLILFKKTALLNSKKFFCVNSFAALDAFAVAERNIYQASEIAQLKPLYNSRLFRRYLDCNRWIRDYFPNFDPGALISPAASERRSILQMLAEIPFRILPSDRLDTALMRAMERHWVRRYPDMDSHTRSELFRCARGESRAYAGDYQGRILLAYAQKLRDHGLSD